MNTKPSIWAYCITTSHAFLEGNIKTARPAPGIVEFMGLPNTATVLVKDIHEKLVSTINSPYCDNSELTKKLITRFPTITSIVSGYTKEAGASVALLVNKNNKCYSVIILGIATTEELSPITSKIINYHLL